MLRRSMMIFPEDSVAMVLEDSEKGDAIETSQGKIELLENVEFAHKVAVKDIKKGEPIIKYREEIGYALKDITKGSWIHVHNMGCDRGKV